MNLKWRKIYSWVILMVILAIVLPACGAGNTSPTLTPIGIEAIYTSAAQTLVAQLTGTAAALPPATPTLTATATGTMTSTLAAVATQTRAAGTVPTSGNSGAVGCNNSLFITDVTIPDKQVVAPGQAFTKTWRVQNTGSCAWNSNYKLTFLSGDVMSGAATAISQTVNVSATADISVSLIAPSSPKTYTGYWKLATDTGQAFGTSMYVQISVSGASVTPGTPGTGTVTALPSATPTFGPVGCYNSAFVSETIPDGTKINPGEAFTKTWVVKNTGTCEWTADFKLVFITNPMGSDTFKIRQKVAVNATAEFAVDMVAPTSPGTYTGIWRLSTDDGQMFGTSFTVRIVVPGATFTPTTTVPTNTVTPTPVPPTNTPIPATRTPTETPTPTPTAGAV